MSRGLVEIVDAAGSTRAQILTGFGFNCCGLQITYEDRPLELLWAEPEFSQQGRPSGSGIPILFPFPGRIQGTRMSWQGKDYELLEGDGRGNAIHGFVHQRPWRLVDQSPSYLAATFQASVDDPSLLERWPADFEISGRYEVRQDRLLASYELHNPDQVPLPCGLGLHPYFRVPLGGSSADDCQVRVPVGYQWELEEMNATGARQALGSSCELIDGMRFGQMKLDNVFGGLTGEDDRYGSSIYDPDSHVVMNLSFSSMFGQVVMYTPPHREAVCIEPYSCVPDPIRLADAGVDAGLIVLEPGQRVSADMEISVCRS